ncbi:ribonuclease M5 [Paenibacillus ginsengarvi]|uniref:Ribonuclease M5 n=1 Tax=Paenibacillus ginsengarvi TaxID=400777 RepID=A0A3B0AZ20_9BACL|nr:ribonuclease M5 [Paenibacillus ginsengarvi]RKN65733.1 ribonuclease M5 [Paenibacillus ginsengarvi]
MIQEIIVVEGRDDTVAIRRAVEAETIETGGSAIGEDVLRRIAIAQQRRGVIIFTDPDHAGERIRKIISARVPGCKHAFLTQEEATRKADIGVENASREAIVRALASVRTEMEPGADEPSDITMDDLMNAGLLVHPQAAARRLEMGKLLGIGYCNGKQFYKRCRMFRIGHEEFARAYKQMTALLEGGSTS